MRDGPKIKPLYFHGNYNVKGIQYYQWIEQVFSYETLFFFKVTTTDNAFSLILNKILHSMFIKPTLVEVSHFFTMAIMVIFLRKCLRSQLFIVPDHTDKLTEVLFILWLDTECDQLLKLLLTLLKCCLVWFGLVWLI